MAVKKWSDDPFIFVNELIVNSKHFLFCILGLVLRCFV